MPRQRVLERAVQFLLRDALVSDLVRQPQHRRQPHPDVAEAAVINVKHERYQARPLLLVVPRARRSIDVLDLMKLYDGAIAKWWYPDAVVVVVDALPHGARAS